MENDGLYPDAISNAIYPERGVTGGGAPIMGNRSPSDLPPGGGIVAFKDPIWSPGLGPNPNATNGRVLGFVTPFDLWDDASRYVNRVFFNRPMDAGQNPDSNPLLLAQYFTPPPIDNIPNLAAGKINLQRQLGNLETQGAKLTIAASDYFGG